MFSPLSRNVNKIIKQLAPSDIVLDIGGWTRPFNRANFVMDIMPYETRGIHGNYGPKLEFFSKDSWIIHDVSSKPLPFKDKSIDFVLCSHILEDIRDPLFLCSEMIRIGKRGYLEVPSRTFESIMGLHGRHYAGYPHHRWLIEIVKNKIIFRFKSHAIHESWKYHLPKSYRQELKEEDEVIYLFWKDHFEFEEIVSVSQLQIEKELEQFIKWKRVYPKFFYFFDSLLYPRPLIKRTLLKYPVICALMEKVFGEIVRRGLKDEKIWINAPLYRSK